MGTLSIDALGTAHLMPSLGSYFRHHQRDNCEHRQRPGAAGDSQSQDTGLLHRRDAGAGGGTVRPDCCCHLFVASHISLALTTRHPVGSESSFQHGTLGFQSSLIAIRDTVWARGSQVSGHKC